MTDDEKKHSILSKDIFIWFLLSEPEFFIFMEKITTKMHINTVAARKIGEICSGILPVFIVSVAF